MQSLHSPGANVSEDYNSHLFNRICYWLVELLFICSERFSHLLSPYRTETSGGKTTCINIYTNVQKASRFGFNNVIQ